jgi:hypothetical protein
LWSDADIGALRQLARANTPAGVISLKIGRTETAIRSKAQREGISLKPIKRGKAKSGRGGRGGKVKSRKQAIAIALSKARKKGKRAPKKKK